MLIVEKNFKHWPSNFIVNLKALQFKDRARLLSDKAAGLTLSSYNPLDFLAEILSLLPIF